MGDWKDSLNEEFKKLEQKRDELRVQLDLGKKEMKSAWGEMEEKWDGLERKMKGVRDEAESASDEVAKKARSLITEIGQGFSRIRRSL